MIDILYLGFISKFEVRRLLSAFGLLDFQM